MNGLTLLAAMAVAAAVAVIALAVYGRLGDTTSRSERRAQRVRVALARAARRNETPGATGASSTVRVRSGARVGSCGDEAVDVAAAGR